MAEFINTNCVEDFLKTVESAIRTNKQSVVLDIATAKTLSTTLALVMTRLVGNYESLLDSLDSAPQQPVFLDGGSWDSKPEKSTQKNF